MDEFVQLAVSRNPRLARLSFVAEAARGRQIQAGLYPNPVLAVMDDELGDRTGPGGILSGQLSQEFVTKGKLRLSQAVAAKEVDQATLNLLAERYALIGGVRAAFYDAYALQQRAAVLAELVRLSGDGVEVSEKLLAAKQVARLDVVQLEVERERFRAEQEAVERELPAAYRRLAAVTGEPRLASRPLVARFDDPPAYDLDQARELVLTTHPEVRAAQVAVERALVAVRRAQVEPFPNPTFTGGYIRQFENRSHDLRIGVSLPIPTWNKNQGNIRAAQAEVGSAVQNIGRVQNDLAERVATAYRVYAAARQRAERYRTSILPRAIESYELALKAFKGGQFEYLRVLQAQRTAAEARLEYNRSLGEAWRAAAELSGLLLEEAWPPAPPFPASVPVEVRPRTPLPSEGKEPNADKINDPNVKPSAGERPSEGTSPTQWRARRTR